jgi:hypothetical protein
MTKAELFEAIKECPDDTQIMFVTDYRGGSFDTAHKVSFYVRSGGCSISKIKEPKKANCVVLKGPWTLGD